ncbi:hypothetical protein Ancab_000313, partial [Ancistrocladus abbreviatus]
MRVENNLAYACYDSQGTVKENSAAWFHLGSLSYTFSANANRFTIIGCDDYALFLGLDANINSIGGCVALCSEEKDLNASSYSGSGCYQTTFPKGLTSFSLMLQTLHHHANISNFNECGYAFVGEKDTLNFSGATDLRVIVSVFKEKTKKEVPVIIEWTVGIENYGQAQLNSSGYACQQNTKCVDFDSGTGHHCQCLPGYEGNPYLSLGCVDIDEYADPNNNPCIKAATCYNTLGNYSCICDGRKSWSGSGYIPIDSKSRSATKGL